MVTIYSIKSIKSISLTKMKKKKTIEIHSTHVCMH